MHFSFLFSLLLLVSQSLAAYTIVCDSTQGSTRIENAIKEAINMAKNARDKLADLAKDTTAAAFEPLFRASDVDTLSTLYERVIKIPTSSLQVTFYCDAAFVDWSDPYSRWLDTAYSYTAKDKSTKSVSLYKVGQDHSKKPGASGSSFSTLGYQLKLPDGEIADFSNQAHIMINKKRWDPPSNDGLDHRPLGTVNSAGLLEGYTALDQLKPLSETVFHELIHVVGGTLEAGSGKKKITDDSISPVVTGKIYGYAQCVKVNEARDNIIAIAKNASPLTRAECPMMLAKGNPKPFEVPISSLKYADIRCCKALYLQIKGKATYWSTGDVDKDTLRPAGIPEEPENNKLKLREIRWRA
ncbi:hypothetical protein O1611_g6010 [Lasiodiplodia mahajangana]|uniref:Uncharacterized protein n=1 Tax=Lasiodiplodia mahajangana TaxID=1108764 RepID=A0ACC2JJC0_9PEZI|nr:hypothetical protein O1611_g6010 [Lasiodiplodia mahajangana]